ncbi:hypothetical protein BHU25_23105 [Pseudomonas vranovensis]|uniref:Uncharacterized protein n=1 Tax=Pseudomonas vranovensis TaxID=321661 RepID=A0A423CZY0_9PSED|nr:hypothetical protein BHU25_23105 [Pseudomonas vranovensis]
MPQYLLDSTAPTIATARLARTVRPSATFIATTTAWRPVQAVCPALCTIDRAITAVFTDQTEIRQLPDYGFHFILKQREVAVKVVIPASLFREARNDFCGCQPFAAHQRFTHYTQYLNDERISTASCHAVLSDAIGD